MSQKSAPRKAKPAPSQPSTNASPLSEIGPIPDSIIEWLPGVFYLFDKQGRLLRWNRNLETVSGYSAEEIAGLHPLDFFPTADKDRVANSIREVFAKGAASVEADVLSKSGKKTPHCLTGTRVLFNGRPCLIGIGMDITERRRTEEALEQDERLLRFLSENLADGMVYQIDCGIDGRQRVFSYVSPAVERLHGLTVDDVKKDASLLYSQVIEKDRALVAEREAHAFATHTPMDGEVRVRLPSGELRWRHFRSAPRKLPNGHTVWDGIELDITERKHAEESLRQREEHYRATLESMTDLLFVIDREGRFADYHAPVTVSLYRPATEFLGKPFGEALPPTIAQALAKAIDVIRDRGPVQRIDYELEIGGRTTFWSANVSPRWSADDAYDGATVVTRNMTEQRLLEEHVRQSEKLTAIGQLAGGVAHDFNNQLAGIMGYAELLVEALEKETLRDYAEGILVATQRAADLTQKLLAFSRKGKYQSTSVAIQPLMAEVIAMLERSIDKRIRISQVAPRDDLAVLGDPSQLQNAFLNVALNARDAMPQGGQLVFTTELVALDAEDCRHSPCAIEPGSYVRVSISDTGVGMTAEQKKHLFEPFFTTKGPGKGTGMGLASVYGTVVNHRGSIHIHSEEGRGTTVQICLPLAADAAPSTHRRPSAPVGGTARILLVDDEEIVRTMTSLMLRNLGYHVTTCADGREAAAYYAAHWRDLDLVILDMVMPELGGRDTFIALRRINPNVGVILSSGYAFNSEVQGTLDEGALAFIGKPCRQSELAEAVAGALAPQ